MGNTKVYISSTYNDLKEYREQVYQALRELRYDVIAMEDYIATDERPLDKCLADVTGCEIYVGIFAWRYGYIPPGQERSITELEYRQATDSGLLRCIFLLDEKVSWPRQYIDEVTGEGERGARIRALRTELGREPPVMSFSNPDELASQVAATVGQLAEERLGASIDLERTRQAQEDERRRTLRGKQKVVNFRPQDVPHAFKDRASEMQALCNHLTNAGVRLITVVGRGGMGKTALVSRVLADLERGVLPVEPSSRGALLVDPSGRGEPVCSPKVTVVLNCAPEDEAKVEPLYRKLRDAGFDPWIASEDILPGERVKARRKRAVQDADFFLACLSPHSVSKEGLFQRDFKSALDTWLEKPESDIYLIPVVLEDVEVPDSLSDVQPVNLFDSDGWDRLSQALEKGAHRLGRQVETPVEEGAEPEQSQLPVDGILYLNARRTGLGLERLYADVSLMLGESAASGLSALWADRGLSLEARVEGLLEAMRNGLYVILLDNLEDGLTEECEIAEEGLRLFVERCLTGPGGARLIATSRDEVKLADAALHSRRCIPLREGLPEDDAVALLRDLDSDPEVPLGLRDAPEEELRRAAEMTRCIPRALESIAGMLWGHPATGLSDLLDDPDLFGEHVVEKLVEGGYRRLGEDERWIMEALAVFNRPVRETAVAFLLQPWFPGLDVQVYLNRLCKGYFVTASRATGEYQLHPLDREYAYRHIPQEPEPQDDEPKEEPDDAYTLRNLELRAAGYYRELRRPQAEWKSIEDLDPQLGEFEHRVHAEDHERAFDILLQISSDYLSKWGHYSTVVSLHEQFLDKLTDPYLKAVNLDKLGNAYRILGQVKQAKKTFQEAYGIFREIGYRKGECAELGQLGLACRDLGEFPEAFELSGDAGDIVSEIGDNKLRGVCLGNLGVAYCDLGDVDRAIALLQEGLVLARETDDEMYQMIWLGHLGIAYREEQPKKALKCLQDARDLAKEDGNLRYEGFWLGHLGMTYQTQGEFAESLRYLDQSLEIARKIEDQPSASLWLGTKGIVYYSQGLPRKALQVLEEALKIAKEIDSLWLESKWLGHLGVVHYRLNQTQQANTDFKKAFALVNKIGGSGMIRLILEDTVVDTSQRLREQMQQHTKTKRVEGGSSAGDWITVVKETFQIVSPRFTLPELPDEVLVLGEVGAGDDYDLDELARASYDEIAREEPNANMSRRGPLFALKVQGPSMEHENIFEGDFVVFEPFTGGKGPQQEEIIVTYYQTFGVGPRSRWKGPTVKRFREVEEDGKAVIRLGPTWFYWQRKPGRERYTIKAGQVRPIGGVIGYLRGNLVQ